MSLNLSALPRDVDALQALVQELASALTAEKLQVEQLKARIAPLRRMQIGRSSEKIDLEIAQLELALDEHHRNKGAREQSEPKALTRFRENTRTVAVGTSRLKVRFSARASQPASWIRKIDRRSTI